MPLGPSPTIGLIAYTTIKVIGYSWVGWKLNQCYQKQTHGLIYLE